MSSLNFNQLISEAKEIDKELLYLRAKITEPSKFGLGREEAVKALKALDKECVNMQNECFQGYVSMKEEYDSMKSDIKNFKDYLKSLNNNLDRIEAMAVKHGYQTFESHFSKKRNVNDFSNISGITELSMADSQFSTPISRNKRCGGGLELPSIVIDHDFYSSTPK